MDRRRLAINRYSHDDMDSLDGLASHQGLLDLIASCTLGELAVRSLFESGLATSYEYAI